MSKQTSLSSFLTKTPPKNTSYLAQLRDELGGVKSSPTANKPPVFENKKRKSFGQSSSTVEKKKKTENNTKEPKVIQTCLDLGQSDYQKNCEECGMFYSPGNEEDEKAHKKFHNESKNPTFSLKGIKSLEQKKSFIDDTKEKNQCEIYVVNSNDKINFNKKCVQGIIERVNRELSYSSSKDHVAENEKIYIYIQAGKLGACAIVESINEAFPIIPNEIINESDDVVTQIDAKNPVKASFGISRIWVPSELRRQGIATRLMNLITADYVFGQIISKNMVAFSQPSSDGKKFATRYFGTNKFCIYTP
jgi:N-acetyltransferase